MAQALYRRYRPQTFSEVIGQNHVADTLRNALRQKRIGHAYLFTGPRGTGKTSTARILAKAVNCLAEDVDQRPDNSCPICVAINEARLLDLIEIDAASNTSVDDVRDLRDRVAFAPSQARYKVYVIDEVHMLSTSAFNALLKTLEEPPSHVIFVLATTEPHKIPATVLSRCQRFDFHRIGAREIAAHLMDLAGREGVHITPEAVGIIARSATGSMRDGISLFDQITAYGHEEVNAELVRDVLGMVSGLAISKLVQAIASGDAASVLTEFHDLIAQGVELNQLVVQLIDHLRTLLLLNVGKDASLLDLPEALLADVTAQAEQFSAPQLLHAIRALNEAGLALKTPFAGYLPVELALLDAVGITQMPPVQEPEQRERPALTRPKEQEREQVTKPTVAGATPVVKPSVSAATKDGEMDDEPELYRIWGFIVEGMRARSPRLQAMLRSGKPLGVEGDAFVIGFRHEFHRQEVASARDDVAEVVTEVYGRPLQVRLVEEDYVISSTMTAPPAPSSTDSIEDDPTVRKAVDEFGAEIVYIEPTDKGRP